MQDDEHALEEEVADLQQLTEQTRKQADQVGGVSRDITDQRVDARQRAAAAKRRELAAHRRAIELHAQAAALQERLGHPERAANAREHAEHARELLARGIEEQGELEP
jgi:hypothetical protein